MPVPTDGAAEEPRRCCPVCRAELAPRSGLGRPAVYDTITCKRAAYRHRRQELASIGRAVETAIASRGRR